MNERTFQNEHFNCTHITVAKMLQRRGVDESLVFNQAGLYFEFQKGLTPTIVIEPYFQNFEDSIKKNYGLFLNTEEYFNMNSYILRIEELLASNYTVGVLVDTYSLDYNFINGGDFHYLHSFEILNKKGREFTVADYFYSHTEEMNKNSLISILRDFQDFISDGRLFLFFLKKGSKKSLTNSKEDYLKTLKNNCRVMRGERCFLFENENKYPGVLGLKAIERCGQKLQTFIGDSFDNRDALISHIYTSLKEVSNSRFHFHKYLLKFEEEELAKLYLKSHQSWIVYANLFMKALMFPDIDMNSRLQKCIDRILIEEKYTLEKMEECLING
ncbi:hypothetical protein KFZ56_05125 [Virgibacillus sp. NKC19-3]|uniref:hypothetical protein n=1 Tax=Virgibacillus saliphilus TaxID=2831674 RepID=UPI001C9B57CD|nr:hypothetical protein [Virgibacillus sp. NKC19-3]MBY7142470.1 hypothetical protein [Virgibacillus sp. NKC19-3]